MEYIIQESMKSLYGKSASCGYARGRLAPKNHNLIGKKVEYINANQEKQTFHHACLLIENQYESLINEARIHFGNAVALMVWAHQQIAKDPGLRSKVMEIIEMGSFTAEEAIMEAARQVIGSMTTCADAYFKERANDVLYVAQWIANICVAIRSNRNMDSMMSGNYSHEPTILVGNSFGLEDVLLAQKNQVVGLVDMLGSLESHTTMIAKEVKLPMVIQASKEIQYYYNQVATLNATQGIIDME